MKTFLKIVVLPLLLVISACSSGFEQELLNNEPAVEEITGIPTDYKIMTVAEALRECGNAELRNILAEYSANAPMIFLYAPVGGEWVWYPASDKSVSAGTAVGGVIPILGGPVANVYAPLDGTVIKAVPTGAWLTSGGVVGAMMI